MKSGELQESVRVRGPEHEAMTGEQIENICSGAAR
jgi:hypothetical protein